MTTNSPFDAKMCFSPLGTVSVSVLTVPFFFALKSQNERMNGYGGYAPKKTYNALTTSFDSNASP